MTVVVGGIFDIGGQSLKILVDTNIVIHLEDHKVIDQDFAGVYQLAISNKCEVSYHPMCLKDIERDKDASRRAITISKLQKYTVFVNPGIPTTEFIQKVGQSKLNDEMDNHQLYQVYIGYADILISEDVGIKSKANQLGISDKVLNVRDALDLLKAKFSLVIPEHPLLENTSTRNILIDLEHPFFDSLRAGYSGFNDWFEQKCARQNRMCYVLRVNNELSAILIYHIEEPSDHKIPTIQEKALKMCTLKVGPTVFGYRLGELFLQKMFALCIHSGIRYLYLTVFPEHDHLIRLLEKFGFRKDEFMNKSGLRELRMIKSLVKQDWVHLIGDVSSHPFYSDGESINKFAIPIQPKYYTTLFKDGNLRDPELFDQTEDSLNEIEGNTISKAYICGSKRLAMKPGDLLFFYSSGKHRVIEPIGILDQVEYTHDVEVLKGLVKNRTVYSNEELEQMVVHGKKVTVLIFRLLQYLNKPISTQDIKLLESYSNNFQTITTLSEGDYQELKTKKYFDERFIIN